MKLAGLFTIIFSLFFIPWIADAAIVIQSPKVVGLSNGLVGHWTFDGKDINGTAASDKSGNGNTGTLTNGPIRTKGKLGQALTLDGVDDYVDIGDAVEPSMITIAAWVKADIVSQNQRIVSKWGGASNRQYLLSTDDAVSNKFTFAITDGLGFDICDSSGTYKAGEWVFVVGTHDGLTCKIYVNAGDPPNVTVENAGGIANTDTNLRIGAEGEDGTLRFDGSIDDVRIYSRALTNNEIKRLYRIGATLHVNTTISNDNLKNGLVGHWTFDGKDINGTAITDRSNQGNTGTMTNGPIPAIGKIGQALKFDGSNDFVNSGSAASLTDLWNSTDITLSAWINPSSFGENSVGRILDKASNSNPDNGWTFALVNSGGTVNTIAFSHDCVTNDLFKYGADNTISLNTWQHVLIKWNGSTSHSSVHIFINGSEIAYAAESANCTGGGPNTDAGSIMRIGNEAGGVATFNGAIDDVRVYNRLLTNDEIRRLYKIGNTFKINTSSTANPSDPLLKGLLGYWTFDGKDLDPPDTPQDSYLAIDRSGGSHNGVLSVVRARPVIGKIGQALDFDGVNTSIRMTGDANWNSKTAVGISVWFKQRSSGGGGFSRLLHKGITVSPSATNCYWEIQQSAAGITFRECFSSGTSGTTVVTTPALDEWHHLVITHGTIGTGNALIYIDGKKVSTTDTAPSGTKATDADAFTVGDWGDGARVFDGFIDDIRYYDRVLSEAEVRRLYQMGI